MWGSRRTNNRGKLLIEWTAEWDVHLVNSEGTSTCIRWRGEFVVNLIWATTEILNRTERCDVLEDTETLSDHRYLVTDFYHSKLHADRRRTHNNSQKEDGTHPQLRR
ncbi:hypothetical protein QLX08_009328 [Tetragonisca angustula]|uniref:Endonuclease/exonuclease/phosphatase domain-containing protein n=1 Tax=Tetragonisca angustula TaxID=166442 RepID=A0AAW0ZHA3_9HYME